MVQYAYPTADSVNEGSEWKNQAGSTTNLYQSIDNGIDNGGPEDTSTYIEGLEDTYNNNSRYVASLGSLTDPESSSDHVLKYAAGGIGPFQTLTLTVELASGTGNDTVIASQQQTFNPEFGADSGVFTLTLTAGEADSITDYSSLYFRTSGTIQDPGSSILVYEVEFQVPDAGGGGGGAVEDPTNPEAFLMFL